VRNLILVLLVALAATPAFSGLSPAGLALAQAAEIVVTSLVDGPGANPDCPSAANCTLREAIATANASEGTQPLRISFDASVFPPAAPAVIRVATPLPALSRANVTIDGAGAGVIVDGVALGDTGVGLRLAGDGGTLRGVHVRHFADVCVEVTGAGVTIGGDRFAGGTVGLGGCTAGLRVTGTGAVVRGTVVGFGPDGQAASPVITGIDLRGGGATVGGRGLAAGLANIIGNATDAIRVGSGAPLAGGLIAGNTIGRSATGMAAGVQRGIDVRPGAANVVIAENTFAFVTVAAVSIAPAMQGPEATGITVSANVYVDLGGIEIDLGADGTRNANDAGDEDAGPNGMLNHPGLTRPTQAVIEGTACGGCRIELYVAHHEPGGSGDHAFQPIASTVAAANGSFAFGSPPVVPGTWVTATATDSAGNTSEFSRAVRVGVGAIQCGNITLLPGWNHAGYFGAATVSLGGTFPGDPDRVVSAVYELGPDGTFKRWLRDTAAGRTLTALVPGRAYWFLLDGPLVLTDGFSLTSPLGIQLAPGWNSVVYFGAGDDLRDAFASLLGHGLQVFRFGADDRGGSWAAWGSETTPGYAREFTAVDPCQAYVVYLEEGGTLSPLHP
jgi:CSLREA domain-containing protein